MEKSTAFELWLNIVNATLINAVTDYVSDNPNEDDWLKIVCMALRNTADDLEKRYKK